MLAPKINMSLVDLPYDIWSEILKHCLLQDYGRLEQVCKVLNKKLKHNQVSNKFWLRQVQEARKFWKLYQEHYMFNVSYAWMKLSSNRSKTKWFIIWEKNHEVTYETEIVRPE